MFKCKTVEFLFRFLPFQYGRGFLIRRHMEKCPRCQERLASMEEVKRLLVAEENIAAKIDLWPAFKGKIEQAKGGKSPPLLLMRRKWGFRLAGALTVILAGALIYLGVDHRKSGTEINNPESFCIQYIKVNDQPAQAFLFQPKDSDMVFVWAEKKSYKES